MSDADPRLAELLRRLPPAPTTLDASRRQAVLAAARQTWFRQRARRRQHLVWLAAAAVLAAVIAGWTLRVLTEPAPLATTPVVARHDPPAAPAADKQAGELRAVHPQAARELAKAEQAEEKAIAGERNRAPALADSGPARKGRSEAAGLGPAPLEALRAPAASDAAPKPAALPAAPPAAPAMAKARPAAAAPADAVAEAGAGPIRGAEAEAPVAAAATAAPAGAAAAEPVQAGRGPLAIARLVLAAATAGQLNEADRRAAAQTALVGLAGIAGPEAADLRSRLVGLLRQP